MPTTTRSRERIVERLRIRPKAHLNASAFASVVLGTTPLFFALYWFASDRGAIAATALAHLGSFAIGALIAWRQTHVFSAVTSTELIGNGTFSPVVRVPLDRIARVTLVPVFVGAAPRPVQQLLVQDAADRVIFRMRGNYWHTACLVRLAAEMPVRLSPSPEPMALRDMFRAYPNAAYWFENKPILKAVMVAALCLVAAVITAVVMILIGLPLGFL